MKKGVLATGTAILGLIAGAVTIDKIKEKTVKSKEEDINKFRAYYNMLNQWLEMKLDGKSLENYFIDNDYRTIAIYGMGEAGNRLYEELKDTNIEVKYAVDKDTDSNYSSLRIVKKNANLENVDVMVITAIYAYDEIKEEISTVVDFPIISLEDVVYGV